MQKIAPSTEWVRTYGSTNGLEFAGQVAHGMGLKAAIGAWLGRDLSANEREISNLIAAARSGQVDLAIVGDEVLHRGDLSEGQLIDYINRVRQQAPGVPVATAEVYGQIRAHPAVVSASDVVLMQIYPYWEGIGIDQAMASVDEHYRQVKAAAGGKNVIVSETGWPSCGNKTGNAVASQGNASSYLLSFVSWARANTVPYFYFEAFDERWKAAYEGPQGACWGIWDTAGDAKPGTQEVLNGKTV